jgi:ferritin
VTDTSFAQALNEQIGNEFAAHQQYVAIAVYYDDETLPQLASFFYRQAVEERNHAMMITQYMLDANLEVTTPGVEAPQSKFADIAEPVALALAQEMRVTEQIGALAGKARDVGDYQGEQFMQWFIKEQTEEVATMNDLVRIVERAKDSPLLIEEYLAREGLGEEGEDPTAPAAAGGAL